MTLALTLLTMCLNVVIAEDPSGQLGTQSTYQEGVPAYTPFRQIECSIRFVGETYPGTKHNALHVCAKT
jgi:hypothetical protein